MPAAYALDALPFTKGVLMPTIPSSQTKASSLNTQLAIKAAMARLPTLHLTLYGKVSKLRTMKSPDPIQQLQSDILSDMYDVVRELQTMLNPILLSMPTPSYSAD